MGSGTASSETYTSVGRAFARLHRARRSPAEGRVASDAGNSVAGIDVCDHCIAHNSWSADVADRKRDVVALCILLETVRADPAAIVIDEALGRA